MNTPLRSLLKVALFAGATAVGFAQSMNMRDPARMVASVDALVSLTPQQRAKVTEIVNKAATEVFHTPEVKRFKEGGSIDQKMRNEIRELLTPEQRAKYDRTSQPNGGGLSLMTPEKKVSRLDELVKLSAGQKTQALQIFTTEFEALLVLSNSERGEKGMAARKTARESARTILTPQQQAIYDAAPQTKGGGSSVAGRPQAEAPH